MTVPNHMLWQETAWNSVRFMAPAEWQICEIGLRHLVFETAFGPVFEVKWDRVKGIFSLHNPFRRLLKQYRHRAIEAHSQPIPEDWQTALSGFESTSFSWQGKNAGGTGLVLFCSACQTATLIQFIRNGVSIKASIIRRILTTFRDHSDSDETFWSIFDIQAVLPKKFDLKHYRFVPGKFELVFVSDSLRITLFRWAPASVLLSGSGLCQWADRVFPLERDHHFYMDVSRPRPEAVWKTEPPEGRMMGWLAFLKGNSLFQEVRCWHLLEKNRILGIKVEGGKPFDPFLLARLCDSYESL